MVIVLVWMKNAENANSVVAKNGWPALTNFKISSRKQLPSKASVLRLIARESVTAL